MQTRVAQPPAAHHHGVARTRSTTSTPTTRSPREQHARRARSASTRSCSGRSPTSTRCPAGSITTASADVAMKGLRYLLEALAKLRTERDVTLIVIGRPKEGGRQRGRIERARPRPTPSTFVSGVPDERIVELYAEAELAVVPSLYEGFSLPAIEAMACGVPLVATTGGALPEVVGTDGETALLVPRRRQRGARRRDPPRPRRPRRCAPRVGAAGRAAGDRALDLAPHRRGDRRAVPRAARDPRARSSTGRTS